MKNLTLFILIVILSLSCGSIVLKSQTSPFTSETENNSSVFAAPESELRVSAPKYPIALPKPQLKSEAAEETNFAEYEDAADDEEAIVIEAEDAVEASEIPTLAETDSDETVTSSEVNSAATIEPVAEVPEISETQEEIEPAVIESAVPVVTEPAYTIEPVNFIKYATDSVNVRAQPDASSERLGHLNKNEAATVTGAVDNGWYRIEFKGSEGFVSGKYLSDNRVKEPEMKQAETTAAPAESNKQSTDKTTEAEAKPAEKETVVEPFTSNVIVADGDVSDDVLYAMQAVYDDLPSAVKKNFEADGWQIIVTDKVAEYWVKDGGTPAPNLIAGFATTRAKAIYVENSMKQTDVIRHEMGHYVDYRIWINSKYSDRRSKSDKFAKIWAQEVEAFKSAFNPWPDNVTSAVEYFAEAFDAYTLNAKLLKESCPNTYAFITECFEA